MVAVQVLSSSEKSEIRQKVDKFANEVEGGNLTKYLYEKDVADGDVEIRFFPLPETGEVEGMRFSVKVYETADWYNESLGSYSRDNLRNGGPFYEGLADELEEIVKEETGVRPNFVMRKGSGAFTCEIDL